ncbi:hypothetical protein QFC24_003595 [Naganishia onofrii]|uniref:Uncharacterized protein n=1 Tax=Naganishia onofrii TaxID=1851511 RepID=A0ACC2XIK8_9TREE|nr:hypothetical protein QFC24_003595 [Naganishia onofrii]
MSARPSSAPKNVHLVVLIHGLWGKRSIPLSKGMSLFMFLSLGNPRHLDVAREELQLAYEKALEQQTEDAGGDLPELQILVAQGNEGTFTYDGIDVCAGRVAREIEKEVQRIEKDGSSVVKDFSVMGYSVGGLIARYLIGLLHSRDPSFFVKHRPVNFTTLATPHVGIVKYRGKFWQWVAVKWGYSLLGRTGDQLYTWDKYSAQDERPLLEVMSDSEEIFIKALNSFQRIDFFANAVQDYTVPYPTGAINYDDPFVETPAKSSVDEEIVVETDEAGIIQRWYTVPIEDGVRKGKPDPPVLFERYLCHAQRTISDDQTLCRPPIFPPFLVFPRPFNWMLYASTPIFMPVFMVGVVIVFIVDSGRSRRRAKQAAGDQPLNETIATAISITSRKGEDLTASSSSCTSSFDRLLDQRSSIQIPDTVDTVRKRLDSAAKTMNNNLVRKTTGFDPELGSDESDAELQITLGTSSSHTSPDQSRRSSSGDSSQTDLSTSSTLVNESTLGGDDGLGSILNDLRHWPNGTEAHQRHGPAPQSMRQQNTTLHPPSSRMHSMVADRTEYKTSYDDKPFPHPAHDHSAYPHRPDLTAKKDVKLELTDVQRRMIRNLNRGIDATIWRKWLTWLPNVGNAHAAISVRDAGKFPEQEHGRGVVRRWAENTVMHNVRKT